MSSRLLLPDNSRAVSPVAWRQAPARGQAATGQPSDPGKSAAEDLARTQQEWEQRVANARAAGARDGEAAGRSGAMAELQVVLGRLARTIEDVAALRSRLRHEAEADTVKLA